MHSEDALLWRTTSCNTACEKIPDASAKAFTIGAYSFSCKVGGKKFVDNEVDFVEK